MPSLEQVLRAHWPEYHRLYASRLTAEQRAAVGAILRCHTQECGGSVYFCGHCQQRHFMPHGCGNRSCPQCGHHHARRWVQRQNARLLPVSYFMVTFTVPEPLRLLFHAHPKVMADVLFKQSAKALAEVAAHPKYLGGKPGMVGVLHTWTRQLIYHPHVHYVVPGVVLTPSGGLKTPVNSEYLLPVEVLKRRYRSLMRDLLTQEHPQWAAQIPSRVWRKGWNVNLTAVGKAEAALGYLGRYVFKTAVSSVKILKDQEGRVSFSYKDSATGRAKITEVSALEFIRRFLEHVLPKGLRRVRTFGWLSPAAKKSFQRVCAILDALAALEPVPVPEAIIVLCPQCRQPMALVENLPRGPPPP